MDRLGSLSGQVSWLPIDLLRVLQDILVDGRVTRQERVVFLNALAGRPMDPLDKGVLRQAIIAWADEDARPSEADQAVLGCQS